MIKTKEDAIKLTDRCVNWIRKYFEDAGNPKAVIGISGGKDSTVVAYLCVKALGKENVIGVLMPNGVQSDIDDSYEVVKNLGIKSIKYDISTVYNEFWHIDAIVPSNQAKINLAPRLRMTTLYFIAQSVGGRVVGTGNLCERMLGYFTLWGDGVCDVNPIGNMLISELRAIGEVLEIPAHLLYKTPSDGLSGKTDEDNFGFSYAEAEEVISKQIYANANVDKDKLEKIKGRLISNGWKVNMCQGIPMFYDEMLTISKGVVYA